MFKAKCKVCGSRRCEAANGWAHWDGTPNYNSGGPVPGATMFIQLGSPVFSSGTLQAASKPKPDTVEAILANMREGIENVVSERMAEVDEFLMGLSGKIEAIAETSPFEPTDAFDSFTDEWDYCIIGTPIFFNAESDRETHLAKAIYCGDPFTIIAHVDLEPSDPELEAATSYVHLPDNFHFDVYEAIVGTAIDNMAAEEARLSLAAQTPMVGSRA